VQNGANPIAAFPPFCYYCRDSYSHCVVAAVVVVVVVVVCFCLVCQFSCCLTSLFSSLFVLVDDNEQNNVDSQQIEFPPTSTSSQPGTSRKKKKKGEKKEGPLFLKDFQSTFMAQKFHVLNCVKDPEINGQHCLEMDDEHFVLLRGTNRNESVHKRIKHFHPEKCGQDLHDNLMEGK
jgi:hypothetical protein